MTPALVRTLRRTSIVVLGAAAILSFAGAVVVLVRFGLSLWLIASLLCLIGAGAARLMLRSLVRPRSEVPAGENTPAAGNRSAEP